MDPADRDYLLNVARQTLAAVVAGRTPERPAPYAWRDPIRRGVFVSIHVGGRLRGCIGTFNPTSSLPETVRDMTAAAAHDPRFAAQPLRPDDLARAEIELSILSPLVRTSDPLALEVGVHGVFIRHQGRTGCFLPQVAREAGWDAATLLSRCCETKVQVPADAWREPDAEVYLFTAERFAAPARVDDASAPSPAAPG